MQSTEFQDAKNNKNSKIFLKHNGKVQEESSTHKKSSSSDQEQDPEVFSQPSQSPVVPNTFMPYVEGPKMDWTVKDGPFHRFLKWHLKCENILEGELVMLPEKRQCKKVIAWSGDLSN